MKADYPLHFINSIANEFQKGKECGDVTFATPSSLFETFSYPYLFIPLQTLKTNSKNMSIITFKTLLTFQNICISFFGWFLFPEQVT